MNAHTYLLKSQDKPGEYPPLTLSKLADKFDTTTRSLHRNLGSTIRRSPDGEWVATERDSLVKPMTLLTEEGPIETVPVRGSRDRSTVARHEAAIRAFAETGNPRYLHDLDRVTVTDANGRRHRLVTDERRVREMIHAGELEGVEPY